MRAIPPEEMGQVRMVKDLAKQIKLTFWKRRVFSETEPFRATILVQTIQGAWATETRDSKPTFSRGYRIIECKTHKMRGLGIYQYRGGPK